tara:strand:- start:1959 stop:2243 length:285 start_codon:yes stop_codon:yes gene_type:complete
MSDEMWLKSVKNMKEVIHELPENHWTFLMNFEPDPERGYCFETNNNYKTIENIISRKTDSDGHSGASFACCLRCALDEIRETHVVEGSLIGEVS